MDYIHVHVHVPPYVASTEMVDLWLKVVQCNVKIRCRITSLIYAKYYAVFTAVGVWDIANLKGGFH